MLDKKLKPWLLEVNESPSFNDDTDVDRDVKGGLIEDTFRLLDIRKQAKHRIIEKDRMKGVVHRNKLGQMNLEERELLAAKDEENMADAQAKYERFQLKNLGGFEKIFPLPKSKPDESDPKLELSKSLDDKSLVYEEIRRLA